MPYFCLREGRARAQRARQEPLRGAQVLVLGVAYKTDIDDTRESPALKLIELLRAEGADVELPRPARAPSCASSASRSVPLDDARSRSSTASSSSPPTRRSTTRDLVERAPLVVDFRNATGPLGSAERQGRQAVTAPVRIGVVGLGYWGPNLARNIARCSAELAWCCDLVRPRTATRYAPQYPQARFTERLRRPARATPTLDAIAIATSVPTHHPLGLRALEAGKHVFVEKPLARPSAGRARARRARPSAARPPPDGRPPAALPPGACARCAELIALGRARRHLLPLRQPREPRARCGADENALWSLGAHDIAVLLDLVGERPRRGAGARRVLRAAGRRGRRLRLPQVPVGRRSRTSTCRWLDPHKMRKLTVVGLAEDGRLRRHGDRPQGDDLRQGRLAARAPTPTAST